MILIYITCKDKEEAESISRYLLAKRLIACANLHPINSLYWWKNKIVNEDEIAILAKTVKENYEKIKKEVQRMHSYDVPCILKISAKVNPLYDDWVKKEVK